MPLKNRSPLAETANCGQETRKGKKLNKYFYDEKEITCTDTGEKVIGYENYLKTRHWRRIRNRKILSDGVCFLCGKDQNLQVHHRTYKRLGEEKESDLIVLCRECHKLMHTDQHTRKFVERLSIESRKKKSNKPKNRKKKKKKKSRCASCVYFKISEEGGKKHPLCRKKMIYYPDGNIRNCRNFQKK